MWKESKNEGDIIIEWECIMHVLKGTRQKSYYLKFLDSEKTAPLNLAEIRSYIQIPLLINFYYFNCISPIPIIPLKKKTHTNY